MRASRKKVAPAGAFTFLEILVGLGVVALLAVLLFPALGVARRKGLETRCTSNLRQIGIAMTAYTADRGAFPTGSGASWLLSALPAGPGERLRCPAYLSGTYAHNRWGSARAFTADHLGLGPRGGGGTKVELVRSPSDCIMVHDPVTVLAPPLNRIGGSVMVDTNKPLVRVHGSAANLLFVDGHVKRTAIEPFADGQRGIRHHWNVDNEPHDENWP